MDRTISFCSKIGLVVAVLALALAGSQVARAQTTDVYTVDYFANANTPGAPDATVRVTNPGTRDATEQQQQQGGAPTKNPPANGATEGDDMCALIYVFDANQQMSECCGCLITVDGLLTLSVNKNLTSNPLLGTKLHTGVIKIVSSDDENPCDPTQTGVNLFPTLRAWATHIQNKTGTTYPMTEGESQAAVLGAGEATDLIEDCTVLTELGSGAGICNCPSEGGTAPAHH
jgi:hypothetical protein